MLPSLLADTQKQNTDTVSATETSDNIASPILWVVADNNEVKNLNQQAKQADGQNISESKIKNSIEKEAKKQIEITTLAQLNKQNVRQRYELGCFWLPTVTEEQLEPFIPTIMRYRDLYAAHLLIAVNNDINLRAYGFTPFDIVSECTLESAIAGADRNFKTTATNPLITLWQFNLYDYKRLPNWLNNKYWANPENWDKHRW